MDDLTPIPLQTSQHRKPVLAVHQFAGGHFVTYDDGQMSELIEWFPTPIDAAMAAIAAMQASAQLDRIFQGRIF